MMDEDRLIGLNEDMLTTHPDNGGYGITPRELQVLYLILSGGPVYNKAIAIQLGIRVGTVKQHIHSIVQKMGIVPDKGGDVEKIDIVACLFLHGLAWRQDGKMDGLG